MAGAAAGTTAAGTTAAGTAVFKAAGSCGWGGAAVAAACSQQLLQLSGPVTAVWERWSFGVFTRAGSLRTQPESVNTVTAVRERWSFGVFTRAGSLRTQPESVNTVPAVRERWSFGVFMRAGSLRTQPESVNTVMTVRECLAWLMRRWSCWNRLGEMCLSLATAVLSVPAGGVTHPAWSVVTAVFWCLVWTNGRMCFIMERCRKI